MNGEASGTGSRPVAALTYLLGFVTGVIFLYLEPFNKDGFVRFHARQSIGFSIVWFAINVVLGVFISLMPRSIGVMFALLQELINLALAVFWVFLMYQAYSGERYRIPELADIIDNVAGTANP